jgi:hypothetical protein
MEQEDWRSVLRDQRRISGTAPNLPFLPIRNLLLWMFVPLRQARVHLQVAHVAGQPNLTADVPSRTLVKQLFTVFTSLV